MSYGHYRVLVVSLLASLSPATFAADSGTHMKEDSEHVRIWNRFADQVFELHQKQLRGKRIRKTEVVGGYRDDPDFYREVIYTDQDSGLVLSVIQWEKDNPDTIHTIEVFVYDEKDRLVRDYSAAYLPDLRNAPVQTLINLHHYNKDLHAFRQFDAGGDVIYEYCSGKFNGKQREIRLFEDDIAATHYDARLLLQSPIYKACFDGLQKQLGQYLVPQ